MARLTVEVRGDWQADRLMAVPYEVVTADGSRVGRGVASPRAPDASVTLPPGTSRAYVLGTLPSGQQIQAPVTFGPAGDAQAVLEFEPSPHEWLQWVSPFESIVHLPSQHRASKAPSRPIGRVWMVLWKFEQGQWHSMPAPAVPDHAFAGARQFTLQVSDAPHLLQVGGERVASRLVSLPPGGRSMVAITQSADAQSDAVRVTIGREQAMNDLVMAYLTRGQQEAADTLVDAWKQADEMLMAKFVDPVGACAGAYALLKLGRVAERRDWVENLVHYFPYADGAIVAACMEMNDAHSDPGKVRHYIGMAVDRGLPIFTLGMSLLVEAMAAVHQGSDEEETFRAAYQAARAYLQCRAVVGPWFAFYGTAPNLPTRERVYDAMQQAKALPGASGPFAGVPGAAKQAMRRYGSVEVSLPSIASAADAAAQPALDLAGAGGLPSLPARYVATPALPLPTVEVFSALE